jgi:acyl carrier protein
MPEQTLVKWNEETILEHLKTIAKEQLNLTPEQIQAIGPSVSLVDALQLDSLAQVVLVTTIEQDFGCAFGLDQWQQLETVQDLVKMIAGRVCSIWRTARVGARASWRPPRKPLFIRTRTYCAARRRPPRLCRREGCSAAIG